MKTHICSIIIGFALAAGLHATDYSETDIGTQINGGQSEKYDIWNVGEAEFGEERVFRISWNMYGIPDRVSLVWNSPDTNAQTYATDYISGSGSYDMTLRAGARKFFVIFNQGDNPSAGTAWYYTITKVGACEETVLTTEYHSNVVPAWRSVFFRTPGGGTLQRNSSATRNLAWDFDEDKEEFCTNKDFQFRVYKISVVGYTKALRIMAPRRAYLAVRKDDKPKPGQYLQHNRQQGSSRRDVEPNMVLILDPLPGDYYVVVAKKTDAKLPGGYDLSGNSHNSVDNRLAIDRIDGGEWRSASVATDGGEFQSIAVGVMATGSDLSLTMPGPTRGQFTLVSHGNIDAPQGMWSVGQASERRWKRPSWHVNWSQGAHWWTAGGFGQNSPRFIPSASAAVARILSAGGVSFGSVDFIGHSYGTYFGSHLSRGGRNFNRFFALDPAVRSTEYSFSTLVDYRNSNYSMAIRAGRSPAVLRTESTLLKSENVNDVSWATLSNDTLTTNRAIDAVLVKTNTRNPLSNHSTPVYVFARILNNTVPAYVRTNFFFAVNNPAGILPGKKIWGAQPRYEVCLWSEFLGADANVVGMYRPTPAGTFGTTGFP